ncbi:MAG: type II toxin-antitoxin system RelE/ParE family toxin [Verrucomicrobiaceae bacterium]|nr:type II toxin-antitoxin system RelE/ParE family toxin [Verrucomicrobiaceae bacterium]
MTVHFESEALEEYREAAQYSEDRFGPGLQFVAAMQVALKEIGRDPARFQPVGDGVRIYRMKRFPYHLFFHHQLTPEAVVVYAVAHHKRRPDYWRDRLP